LRRPGKLNLELGLNRVAAAASGLVEKPVQVVFEHFQLLQRGG
jgi:hypothetical protein